jgi:hypothetical protein
MRATSFQFLKLVMSFESSPLGGIRHDEDGMDEEWDLGSSEVFNEVRPH